MAIPISNVTRRVVYAASGTGPYAFTFEILANTDIGVYKDDALLTLTTDYTVTIASNGTGSITLTAAPTGATQIAIVGNRTIQRTTDFVTGGDFFANTVNAEMDQQTIFAQQNAEGLQRALSAPQTDPTTINMTLPRASLRANKALGFDADGNPAIADTLGTNRGNWAAGTLYYVRDIVKDTTNNNIWQAIVQHTSSGSQPINTNADSANWTLLVDAASATTSASNAATSASAAATSASAASTSASAAAGSASTASTQASNASTSASNAASSASAASSSATAAASSATSAASSATAAAASYDAFDDRYLGSKSSDPSVDNDGNALLDGALYWDTANNILKVYDLGATAWRRTTPTSTDQTAINTVSFIQASVNTVAGIANNVTTVAPISSNIVHLSSYTGSILTVSNNIANVNFVGGSIANVNSVASNLVDILAVSANQSDIDTVAGLAPDVTTVAGISGNVTTVASNVASVSLTAGSIANVNLTGGSIDSVNAVAAELGAGNDVTVVAAGLVGSDPIGTVATSIANVNAVGGSINSVNNVAGSIANVNTVASDLTSFNNIGSVANNIGDVNTVATNNANVTTVAGSISNVNTNATNIANINQNAANIVAIQNASANATAAANSATAASGSATAAAASAAAASAVVLGNEPVRPAIRPSLLLDFANTKALDPRITFTRASTATFYDGRTVAKAEENLVLQSQEFNVALGTNWFLAGSGVTAVLNNAVAPDGTTTADTLTITTADTGVRQSLTFTNGLTYSISVYVRSVSGATGFTADLQNGQTSPSLTLTSSWQRFTWTVTASATRTWLDFQLNGAGSFEIWGAQVEERSAVTAYTPTTTQPITNYIPALQTAAAGVARFDHNPTTFESLGLLIEEQRTNLLNYSEQFNDAYWNIQDKSTVSPNVVVAPDGTLSADALIEDTTFGEHYEGRATNILSSGVANTISVYAKSAGRSLTMFATNRDGVPIRVRFNLTTGVTTTLTAGGNLVVHPMLAVGNGWWRCALTLDGGTGGTSSLFVFQTDTGSAFNYTGNGFSGIHIWGAQLEAGAFPTSYIPTVASQVTRSTDAASMTGTNFSSWYRADEGTLYGEANCSVGEWPPIASLCRSDNSYNTVQIQLYASGGLLSGIEVGANGAAQAGIWNSITSRVASNKLAGAYKTNDVAVASNGGTVGTDTSVTLTAHDTLRIGRSYSNSIAMNGTIKKLAYYPARVTNAQLQGMTTV